MNEDTANRTLRSVQCEKHGLRYDPSTQSGCALCRREAAGMPTMVAAPPSLLTTAGTPAASASLGAALGVTALLLALATFGLFALHSTVAGMLKGFAPPAQSFSPPQGTEIDPALEKELRSLQESAAGFGGPAGAGGPAEAVPDAAAHEPDGD